MSLLYTGDDAREHTIDLGEDGIVTFSWINDVSLTQTCCWSVTNARIIELNPGGQPGSTDAVLLGDMCISGTSYECTDNTIWLCSESSLFQTPPAVELRSNSFTLGASASDVHVNSKCSSNNNIPSTNPPGLISCDILTPSLSSSSTQQTTSTSTISTTPSTSTISSTPSTSTISTTPSTSTISSTPSTSTVSTTPSTSTISTTPSTSTISTTPSTSTISTTPSTSTISSTPSTSTVSTTPSTSTISSTPSTSTVSTTPSTSTVSTTPSTSTISSDTSTISSDTSTISSDTSIISSTSVISFVTTQSPSPSNINLQTCNSDGDLWSQTPVGTNVTGIGACYNGTVNGELLIMTDSYCCVILHTKQVTKLLFVILTLFISFQSLVNNLFNLI